MLSCSKKFALFILLFVAFIDWMGIGLVYPMFSSMFFHRDIQLLAPEASDAMRGFWLGILLALMPIAQFFSSPILGTLSDQKGRRPLLKIALLFGVVGYLIAMAAIWMESLQLLLLSRVIIGISAGSGAVVGAALADLSEPQEKAKNFALLSMAAGLGFTVGPFIGGQLSESSYAMPFLFSGVLTFLNFLLLVYFLKESHFNLKKAPFRIFQGLGNLKKAFTMPTLRVVFLSVFCFSFGWTYFWEFIPVTWIEAYAFSAADIGKVFAYAAAMYALSCGLLIRPIVSRVRPQLVLFYALIVLGFYIFVLLSHPHQNYLWGYVPLQQFLIALLFPTASAMISNCVQDDAQGEMMGVLHSVQSGAFALSPLLSGAFVGLNTDMPIIVGGSAMLLAAGVLFTGISKEILKPRA